MSKRKYSTSKMLDIRQYPYFITKPYPGGVKYIVCLRSRGGNKNNDY